MSEIWLGKTLQKVHERRIFDVSGGWQTEIVYEGTHEEVKAAAASLFGVNYVEDYATGTPVARLTITSPDASSEPGGTEEPVVRFELINNTAQKSGYEHWRSLALGANAIHAVRERLRQQPTEGQTNSWISSSGFTGNQQTLLEAMARGQDSFVSGQWVFRISQVIKRGSQVSIAMSGLNKVYSTLQLINETNPVFPFRDAIIAASNQVGNEVYQGAIPAGHTLGWLKASFAMNNISGNRVEVSAEYWLEAWLNFYYS